MKHRTFLILALGVFVFLGACSAGGSGGGGDLTPVDSAAKWFIEKGPPTHSQGANGDLWFDTDAAIVYVKTDGQWVAASSVRGPAGSGWLVGTGAPSATLGKDGDLYLDTGSTMSYRKAGGVWTLMFTLQGTQWFSGSAEPTPAVPAAARTGDYYFQTSTAMIYKKDTGGYWSSEVLLSYHSPSFIYTPRMEYFESGYQPFNAVAYGGGKFVAVGDNGLIARSGDGTNWQVVSYYGSIAYSVIGKGLQPYEYRTDISDRFTDVAYGNGVFVAVSEYSIYTSSDGYNWVGQSPGVEEVYRQVAFLNGAFFVSPDYSSTIFKSADGVNWSSQDAGASYLTVVAYGNGKYLSIAQPDGLMGVCTSTDGTNWSYTSLDSMTGLSSSSYIASVVFGSGLFVAVGYENIYGIATIWISTDGIHWSSQDLPVSGSTEFLGIAYGNGFAVVGFDSSGSYQNLILTSSNGVAWNIQTLPYSADLSGIYPSAPTGTFVISRGYQRGL